MAKEPIMLDTEFGNMLHQAATTRRHNLRFEYDEESKCILLFDGSGYVGTVMTPQSLWNTLEVWSRRGEGSPRFTSGIPTPRCKAYGDEGALGPATAKANKTPPRDEQVMIDELLEKNIPTELPPDPALVKRIGRSSTVSTGPKISLEDLDIDLENL